MVFDKLEQKWRDVSLDELAMENDPDMEICVTTTYGWLANNLAIAKQTKEEKKEQMPKVEIRPPEEIVAEYRPISKTMHYLRSMTSQITFVLIAVFYLGVAYALCIASVLLDMKWLIPFIIIGMLSFPSLCIKFFPMLKNKLKKN